MKAPNHQNDDSLLPMVFNLINTQEGVETYNESAIDEKDPWCEIREKIGFEPEASVNCYGMTLPSEDAAEIARVLMTLDTNSLQRILNNKALALKATWVYNILNQEGITPEKIEGACSARSNCDQEGIKLFEEFIEKFPDLITELPD